MTKTKTMWKTVMWRWSVHLQRLQSFHHVYLGLFRFRVFRHAFSQAFIWAFGQWHPRQALNHTPSRRYHQTRDQVQDRIPCTILCCVGSMIWPSTLLSNSRSMLTPPVVDTSFRSLPHYAKTTSRSEDYSLSMVRTLMLGNGRERLHCSKCSHSPP